MMWNYYNAWAWLWMASLMILVWSSVVVIAVWAIRSITTPRQPGDKA